MSLEKLLQKVDEKDKEIISKIIADANFEIEHLQKVFDTEIANYSKTVEARVEENLQFLQNKSKIDLEIYKKKAILEIKSRLLDTVYESFRCVLKSWDIRKYEAWVLKKINEIDFLNKSGELVVGIGSFADKIDDIFKKNIFDSLGKLSLKTVKLSFETELEFGLKYYENTVIIDESLDVFMLALREENELALNQILFPREG